MVDKHKDEWAAMQNIPLLRLWENDIRKKPRKVMSEIKKYVEAAKKKKMILENRKKPH
jgi:very-short-patch-repair endonuclease